jgi:hypothetical protein
LDNHDFDPEKRPEDDHLKGGNALFNLMNAYAHYDKEIGYC